MTVLAARALRVAYGEREVLHGIDLELLPGEIVALIGPNGAGKSTTLRAIAGVLPPRRGTIRFSGQDVTATQSYERSKLGIALVPEGRHVFPFLTVRENLELGGFNVRNDAAKVRQRMDGVFAMFPRLSERTSQNAGTLSGGEQQMLVLGRAMMSEPQLLCLDEPSLGLAPIVVQDIFQKIKAINAAGTSVLLVEQNARYAFETASRGYVLQTGSVIASGSCAELKLNPRVQEAYPEIFSKPPNGTTALQAFQEGKIISPLGIEGLHSIGNSLAHLRMFFDLGVSYATLTHNCHNKYADAALVELPGGGIKKADPIWHGVSPAGQDLVYEMNRLGMIIDLAHVSVQTMRDVLGAGKSEWPGSQAPVIFSHSSAHALCPHPRNVPDDVLALVRKTKSIVMVNFAPDFISCSASTSSSIFILL